LLHCFFKQHLPWSGCKFFHWRRLTFDTLTGVSSYILSLEKTVFCYTVFKQHLPGSGRTFCHWRRLVFVTLSLNSTYRGLVVYFVTGEDLSFVTLSLNCTYRGLVVHFVTGEDWLANIVTQIVRGDEDGLLFVIHHLTKTNYKLSVWKGITLPPPSTVFIVYHTDSVPAFLKKVRSRSGL
jgi:hypothetical protein